MTVGHHLPSAIPRSDEAKWVGAGRIAKDIGVINRINSDQTARDHIPTLAATVAIRPSRRRSGAENAQGGGDCKCDESFVSNHGGLLLIRADCLFYIGTGHTPPPSLRSRVQRNKFS